MLNRKIKVQSILLITFLFIGNFCFGQATTILQKLEEVYGEIASTLSPEEISNYENYLSRCSVINISEVPTGISIQNLSDLGLVDKYGAILSHDTNYNPLIFNPLKYTINFMKTKDQYFRIGITDSVLKIDKNL